MIHSEPTPASPDLAKNPEIRAVRWIALTTAVLVGLLAIAAFALSFEALRDLAIVTGAIPNPKQAWLFPVLLDGGVVVFSLAALRASLTGSDRRWYMTLVVIVTLLSVGLNVAHASRGLLAAVMAGMPPLLLFMAFESLMRQIQDSLKITIVYQTNSKRLATKRNAPVALPSSVNKERAIALMEEGWSKNRISRELGVSPSTVSRYLRQVGNAQPTELAA